MRIYIAYKYTNNQNKEALIQKVEEIAATIDHSGNESFLLGRDVKKWKHMHLGLINLIPIIYSNIKKSDLIVAYIDCDVFSKGLLFELIISKLLGKKSIAYCVNSANLGLYKGLFNKKISISDSVEIKQNDFVFV